jgi:hypothetical protein
MKNNRQIPHVPQGIFFYGSSGTENSTKFRIADMEKYQLVVIE